MRPFSQVNFENFVAAHGILIGYMVTTSFDRQVTIIKGTASTIKGVAEGAAGNILGELAKPHVATLLALAAGG